MSRRNLLLALSLAGLALFLGLLVRLMLLRYERGDVYPPYSTLRADPSGTRAYYEALASLPGYSTARGFTVLHREIETKPSTLFYLGLGAEDIASYSRDEVEALDAYVKNGGRVVLTFSPESSDLFGTLPDSSGDKDRPSKPETKPPTGKTTPAPSSPAQDNDASEPQTQQEKYERDEQRREQEEMDRLNHGNGGGDEPLPKYHPSVAAVWGFGWMRHPENESNGSSRSEDETAPKAPRPEVMARRTGEGPLEAAVPWKSPLYFVRLEPAWEILYRAKSKPVLIRRAWGRGEIVVAGDSYFVSNEALRNDRRPALLGFLAGPAGLLLFDETHLGTEHTEGVMTLVNRFRLEGYFYGLLGVAALFLWRNSVPLVPPRPAAAPGPLGGAISGQDSRSGLVNLLRRNIAPREILQTGFNEWKRTATPAQPRVREKTEAMNALLAGAVKARPEEIVRVYHQLCEINRSS